MPSLSNAQKLTLRRIARGIKKQNPFYNVTHVRTHLYQVLPTGSNITHKNIHNTITNRWYQNTNFF